MPLAFHVTLLGLTALMPFGIARIYALFGLALVAVHVMAGILVGGGDWRDFGALLWAPFYVAWKLAASAQNSAVSSERGTLDSDRSLTGKTSRLLAWVTFIHTPELSGSFSHPNIRS